MPRSDSDLRARRRRAGQPSLVGCCVAVPLLLVGMAGLIVWNNNRPVRIAVPTPRMPNPNAYDDFVRAGVLARSIKHKSPASMPKPVFTFAAFEAAAKDAQPALAVLHQGFGREYLNPPIRTVAAMRWPELASFRELARTEWGVANYHEMEGRPAQATEARLDTLEMAGMIPRGGTVIHGLVSVACKAIALSQIEPPLYRLSDAELALVASRWDRIAAKRVPFADLILEDGYVEASTDAELFNDPKRHGSFDIIREALAEDDPSAPGTGKKKPLNLQQNWQALRFLLADKTAIIRENQAYNAALAAKARKPYDNIDNIPIPDNLLAHMRSDIFTQGRAKYVGMEAAEAVVRVEIALLRYRIAHGRYPDALAAMAPAYLAAEKLIDPCGGAPLHYSPLKNGQDFLLYSVGTDQKDDHGSPSRFVGTGPGDLVAGKMWRRRVFTKK